METMTPLDAAFLALEDADPGASLHIGSVGIFEGPIPSHDDILLGFERKLPLVPRYRQRVRTLPLSLGPPVWVDDDQFDVRYHVRRTALPAPGDDTVLHRLVGRVMSHRLDRAKPLWEAWVVEGLAGGRWALISKVHHCMVDGISGTDLLAAMLELTPDAVLPPPQPWQPQPAPSTAGLVADALLRQVLVPVRVAPGALRALRSPRATATAATRFAHGAIQYVEEFAPTSRTSLSGSLGPHRRWRTTSMAFDDIALVRRAFGGSVNDVALAACTAGLRQLLVWRHEEPGRRSVRSLVPVSTRASGEEGIRDNRVSAMFVELPVHLCDPVEQFEAVRQELALHKATGEAAAGQVITRAVRYLPFALVGPMLRSAFRLPQRYLTTVTTNVPGPPFPLYAFGRRMAAAYPYVPLGDRLRVGIAMFSYCGQLNFGVTSDAAAMPDADMLVAGIEIGMSTLLDRARRARGRRGGRRAPRADTAAGLVPSGA